MKVDPKASCLTQFVGKELWDIGYNDLSKDINLIFKDGDKLKGFQIPLPKYVILNDCKIVK